MRVVIAGGTGFLGSPLAETYAEDGHDVRLLTRGLPPGESRHESGTGVPGISRVGWNPDGQNRPVGRVHFRSRRGDQPRRRLDRRKAMDAAAEGGTARQPLLATRSLAAAITQAAVAPKVFISSSAVGYYGALGRRLRRPNAMPAGSDFLAHLCEDWEAEAHKAARDGTRRAIIRTGLVLEKSGGALAQMITPFRLFAGGPMGSGRQYMSWVHRLDWIEMVRWIVQTPEADGTFNVTAPHPVTNREFARALGRSLKRPALLPAPGFALKLVLGEFANSILTGQRVVPAHAQALGYHFRYPELDIAFRGIFGD